MARIVNQHSCYTPERLIQEAHTNHIGKYLNLSDFLTQLPYLIYRALTLLLENFNYSDQQANNLAVAARLLAAVLDCLECCPS